MKHLYLIAVAVSLLQATQTRKLDLIYDGPSGPPFYKWAAQGPDAQLRSAIPLLAVERSGRGFSIVRRSRRSGTEVSRRVLPTGQRAYVSPYWDHVAVVLPTDEGTGPLSVEDSVGRVLFSRADVQGLSPTPIGVYIESHGEGAPAGRKNKLRIFSAAGDSIGTIDGAWLVDGSQMRPLMNDTVVAISVLLNAESTAAMGVSKSGRVFQIKKYARPLHITAVPRARELAASSGGKVDVLDLAGHTLYHETFLKDTYVIPDVAFSPEGDLLAVSCPESPEPIHYAPFVDSIPSVLKMIDLKHAATVAERRFAGTLYFLASSPDGGSFVLFTGGQDLRLLNSRAVPLDSMRIPMSMARQLRDVTLRGNTVVLRGDNRVLCYRITEGGGQ
jgi:hypothetical protein